MDRFSVKLTYQANQQITDTVEYIAHKLNVPMTALKFADLIERS